MSKAKKPLTPEEKEKKRQKEELRARRKAELDAIMASDNPPEVHIYRNKKPYKDGWNYVYDRHVVHVKLLGKNTSVELKSCVVGKLPPGEADVSKMIPTGDTGPKGKMKRLRAAETGEPLYKEYKKSTREQESVDGSQSKPTEIVAENQSAESEETKPRAGDLKRIDARDPSRVKIPLHLFILVVLWGYMQGKTSCTQIAMLWNTNIEYLSLRFVDFPNHKISHDTVLRLIKLIGRFTVWSLLRFFTDNIISVRHA